MSKLSKKTISFVRKLFEQGDTRYYDPFSINIVANFLELGGITVEKEHIEYVPYNQEEAEKMRLCGPQKEYKFVGAKLLEKRGYKLMGFERRIPGGITDILAKHLATKEKVAVECCSCRTDKAIDYLELKNTTLWIISLGDSMFLDEGMDLFIIKRGSKWGECLKLYNQKRKEMLKNIPDLLDFI